MAVYAVKGKKRTIYGVRVVHNGKDIRFRVGTKKAAELIDQQIAVELAAKRLGKHFPKTAKQMFLNSPASESGKFSQLFL